MSQVNNARDRRLERLVALTAGRSALRRYRGPSASSGKPRLLQHRTIPTPSTKSASGTVAPSSSMEVVAGKPLDALILSKGMRLTEALRIAAQVCSPPASCLRSQANIMVDARGRVNGTGLRLGEAVRARCHLRSRRRRSDPLKRDTAAMEVVGCIIVLPRMAKTLILA
jgi:hypothetical protein